MTPTTETGPTRPQTIDEMDGRGASSSDPDGPQSPTTDGARLTMDRARLTMDRARLRGGGQAVVVANRKWTRRRVLAAVLILAVEAFAVQATVGWLAFAPGLWHAMVVGILVLSSLTLALFVPHPGAGWRPEIGCAPCAVGGAVISVVAPWMAVTNAPDTGWTAIALLFASMAFARKLTEPATCE